MQQVDEVSCERPTPMGLASYTVHGVAYDLNDIMAPMAVRVSRGGGWLKETPANTPPASLGVTRMCR